MSDDDLTECQALNKQLLAQLCADVETRILNAHELGRSLGRVEALHAAVAKAEAIIAGRTE